MSKETLCNECGEVYGTNRDCEECMEALLMEGADGIDEEEARDAVSKFEEWEERKADVVPANLFEKARLFFCMLRDYWNDEYPDLPWKTVAFIAFAILYLINPIDLIPDFIPVLGWLDDAAVMAAAASAISTDIEDYQIWIKSKKRRA